MKRGLKDRIDYVIGYIILMPWIKLIDWLGFKPYFQMREEEGTLRWSNDHSLFTDEMIRRKGIEFGAAEIMIQAVGRGIEEIRSGIDWEMLRIAKKEIFRPYDWHKEYFPGIDRRKDKIRLYLEMLRDLILYQRVQDHRLHEWFDLYMLYHKTPYYYQAGCDMLNPGIYHVARDVQPQRVSTEKFTVPAVLYFQGQIAGYPEPETIEMENPFFKPGSQKPKHTKGPIEPVFRGKEEDVCTVAYDIKGIEESAESLIRDIQQFYADKGWKPLGYEAASPYRRGGLYGGWEHEYSWSQCWVNPEEDIVRVLLKKASRYNPFIRARVTFVPHRYTKEALRYYDRLHGGREVTGEVPTIPLCPYEEFPVFPFPPLGTGLPEGVICLENLITGQYKRNLEVSRGLFAQMERKTENSENK